MKVFAMTAALVLLGTASMAQTWGLPRPQPRPTTTIQTFGGVTTIRDSNGGSATAQTFGGVTTIRGSDGSSVSCQTFAGITTCR